MTHIEAMKHALVVLENIAARCTLGAWEEDADEAISGLSQAIAEAENPTDFAKVFAQMKTDGEPCNEVLALGQMMRDWLQHQVSDNGSAVDTGKGFSEYDLWVMCEGKELSITIKEKRPTK